LKIERNFYAIAVLARCSWLLPFHDLHSAQARCARLKITAQSGIVQSWGSLQSEYRYDAQTVCVIWSFRRSERRTNNLQ
jgi:hypothetical protein